MPNKKLSNIGFIVYVQVVTVTLCMHSGLKAVIEKILIWNIYECSEIDNEGAHVVDDYEDFSFLYTNEFEVIEQ